MTATTSAPGGQAPAAAERDLLEHFTRATAWDIGDVRVGLVACRECGAAVLIDERNAAAGMDAALVHLDWHQRQARR